MNIKELNKLIKEELDAFLENEDELDAIEGGDDLDAIEGGDEFGDIEVTTDEPAEEEDPLALLRQIYDMLKPVVDDEGEGEDEFEVDADEEVEDDIEGEVEDLEDEEEEVEESLDRPNYKASDVSDVTYNSEKLKGGLNESVDVKARFQKLANIKK